MPIVVRKTGIVMMFLMILSNSVSACGQVPLVASTAPGIGVGITAGLCPNVEVEVGQQVTWTNQADQEHMIREMPEQGSPLFDSGSLAQGDSFQFTFTQPGTYRYECSSGASVLGTLTVK